MKRNTFYGILFILVAALGIQITAVYACDTWVALPDATAIETTILAKNSDRSHFDCQPLVLYHRQTWPEGATIDLGRITIPQVKETYATIGSHPYWCWGYEEGMNEFGVAIGNEGIWTKTLAADKAATAAGSGPEAGPTGMDLLRLGLERGKTAREALEVMTGLLETYGQFGSGMPTAGIDGAYDNSYIIADPEEAWILETAGKQWVAKEIKKGVASISNETGIGAEFDMKSPELIDYAATQGWWSKDSSGKFNFSEAYGDNSLEAAARCKRAATRAKRSLTLLNEKKNAIDLAWMKRIARDRGSSPCIDLDQTASSCIAVLPKSDNRLPVFWWCPAVPSQSCYIPFFVHGGSLPDIVSASGTYTGGVTAPSEVEQDSFSEKSLWWLFKDLNQKATAIGEDQTPVIRAAFDRLEQEFAEVVPHIVANAVAARQSGDIAGSQKILDDYTSSCVDKAVAAVNRLRADLGEKLAVAQTEYAEFLGTYTANFGNFRNTPFTVMIKNDHLAVDVPGQMTFELKPPDDEGRWEFMITDAAAVSFERNESGRVAVMWMHQASELQRGDDSLAPLHSGNAAFAPYEGAYMVPVYNRVYTFQVADHKPILITPETDTIPLIQPDLKERWYFAGDPTTYLTFVKDATGTARSMKIHQSFPIPKGLSAAAAVRATYESAGIDSALSQYFDLKFNHNAEYYFSEHEFNNIGYDLMGADKLDDAIKIFRINIDAFPQSWNVYDSMGEACLRIGDTTSAISNYRRTLELNPNNKPAQEIMNKLTGGR